MKTLFDSILQSFTTRITEVEKSVQSIKTSLQFTQKDVDNLKPLEGKLDTSNKENLSVKIDLIDTITFIRGYGKRKPLKQNQGQWNPRVFARNVGRV